MANSRRILVLAALGILSAPWLTGQTPPAKAPAAPAAPANPFLLSPEERARLDQLSREDHADMMRQLGITKLRPGFNGFAKAGEPNAANYDPAKANPYPDWPDVLTLKDGGKVTTAETWWQKRRPEIALDFEREVYGRVPADVPRVTWTVAETVETTVGGQPVVARRVVGHVDNSAYPAITVDIKMAVLVPVNAKGPVPVLIMFGWGNMPGDPLPRFPGFQEPAAPPSTDQLIASGWGYVSLSTASIQADNGAGLTAGIIGLTNKGKRRTPEQWGSLRAWAWGAARALDYLETLPAVDAKRVGIEGVSRYGKAALVTMAFEPRFAVVLVGSSGEGGAKPHRRNFGEAVENLTGSGAYHWMAGNFLNYGAAEASFGSRNANDIPVDAHELIALCAPRPTFISYGIPEKGDANWLDQQGSYMATVAASPVFDLLGARGLGVTEDYRVAKMPPVNKGLLDGQLAWRQHDGGHEDRSNTSFFIGWANKLLGYTPSPVPADQPQMRADRNSHLAHQQLLAKAKAGGIDLYFEGDSITRRWGATDYPDFLAHWKKTFYGWNAGDFGWGADRTENILWRLSNGELDGVNPKAIVILAGTNNVGKEPGDEAKVRDVTRGLQAIVDLCRKKAPGATIVLTAIFPRNDNPAVMPTINRINANLARMADGKSIRFLDVNARLADAKGTLFEGMMVDGLHPSLKGYEVWAEGLKPILTELLGPPAATDHAPPPTGDPSASARPQTVDVSGEWVFEVSTSQGGGSPTFVFRQDGEKLTGTYKGLFGEAEVVGTVTGKALKLSFTAKAQGTEFPVTYEGEIESNDSVKGTVDLGGMASGTFTGKRKKDAALAHGAFAADEVRIESGRLQAAPDSSPALRVFRGIPYAEPPVGELRWKAPLPAKAWPGIRPADKFGPRCVQRAVFSDMVFRSDGMSEDCLYLNVWAPARPEKERLPVLVYFYGGGYRAGDGSEPRYDGAAMAGKGIVALTVNYRLGVFGFFAHPELSREAPYHASGNYGLLDQNAALRWVQRNIAAFGGDPKRVTIAGESAGSISVSAHVASPLSKDLIAGAIMESGSLIGSLAPRPLPEAEQEGVKFAARAGASSLAALRAMSAEKVLELTAGPNAPRLGPTTDGYLLPRDVAAILDSGEQAHVPLLGGSNSEEQPARALLRQDEPTPENYAKAVKALYGDHADEVLKLYPGSTMEEVLDSATALAGDRFVGFSTWRFMEGHRKTAGKPVYRYYYAHPRPKFLGGYPEPPGSARSGNAAPPPPPRGASHSAEIEYAMGNLATNTHFEWSASDHRLSEIMQGYFANFTRTGDPNGPGLPTWPTYDSNDGFRIMRLDVEPRAEPEGARARYLLLDSLR